MVTAKPEPKPMADVGEVYGHFNWPCPPNDEERAALLAWAKCLRQTANQLSKAARSADPVAAATPPETSRWTPPTTAAEREACGCPSCKPPSGT